VGYYRTHDEHLIFSKPTKSVILGATAVIVVTLLSLANVDIAFPQHLQPMNVPLTSDGAAYFPEPWYRCDNKGIS
jgi:hypothetical protein